MTPHANALLRYYARHGHERGLPWRAPGESIVRASLVEGLLAMTTARSVAEHYQAILGDVRTPENWASLPCETRQQRVGRLGLGRQKKRAMDAIAEAMTNGAVMWPQALTAYLGLGEYTAGMIGLLHGAHAAPVDTNVDRVGRRAAMDGDPGRWIDQLVRAARAQGSVTGRPPGYEVVSAVLDIGATRCRTQVVDCGLCPLGSFCASRRLLDRQVTLSMPWPPPKWRSVWTAVNVRLCNLDCQDWEVREVRIEAGWRVKVGELDCNAGASRLLLDAVDQSFSRLPNGEHDVDGQLARIVARRIVNSLHVGTCRWCRVLVGEGVGAITEWANVG